MSVPTANRIKKSGIIDKAITQIGRKIVVDADLRCLWQRNQVESVLKSSSMDGIWKQQLTQTATGILSVPSVTLDSFLHRTKI